MDGIIRRGLSLGKIACSEHRETSLIPWKQITKTEGTSERIYLCCPECSYAVRIVAKTLEFGEYVDSGRRLCAKQQRSRMQRLVAWLRRFWPLRQ